MSDSKRWLELEASLPEELSRALASAPGEPDARALEQLATELGKTLGVTLPAAKLTGLATAPKAGTLAKVGASTATAAAPVSFAWVTGIVLGGALVGGGLSAAATYGVGKLDGGASSTQPSLTTKSAPEHSFAVAVREATLDVAPAANVAPSAAPSLARAARPSQVTSSAPPERDAPQESELQLLKRAQVALGPEPAAALRWADLHARQFAGGALAQEREVIAVDALMRLGRTTSARARAERFRASFPGSAHQRRVDILMNATTQGATQP